QHFKNQPRPAGAKRRQPKLPDQAQHNQRNKRCRGAITQRRVQTSRSHTGIITRIDEPVVVGSGPYPHAAPAMQQKNAGPASSTNTRRARSYDWLGNVGQAARYALQRASEKRLPQIAASLTYTTVLA